MKQLADWRPGKSMHVLSFGISKVGKTFGAGSFPHPCWLNFDPGGIETLVSPEFIKAYGFRNIPYEDFYETQFKGAIVKAHTAYDNACKFFDEMMAPGKRDSFETWVIDSATMLGEFSQNKAVILLGSKEYHNQSSTQEQALKYGLLVPKIQDYGAERSLVEQFIDMVVSTDKHVVCICHEKEQMDKEGNLIGIVPLLTGKSAEAVPLKFSEVYNIRRKAAPEIVNGKPTGRVSYTPVCQTAADGLRKVGSRNGVADSTPWNYIAILAELTRIHKEREALKASAGHTGSAAVAQPSTVP